MKTEAEQLADTIDNSEETTGFERRMASVMRGQAAEIERLKAELGDLPEAQAMLLSDCKRKDALLRQALEALDDSRDDVCECLNMVMEHAGYERYDKRIAAYQEQLAKHDAAIAAIEGALK